MGWRLQQATDAKKALNGSLARAASDDLWDVGTSPMSVRRKLAEMNGIVFIGRDEADVIEDIRGLGLTNGKVWKLVGQWLP